MRASIRVRPEQRREITRAILDDEADQNGEHLYDGERLLFYCPMQGGEPPDRLPRVPVRRLLPAGMRIPSFADYLATVRPGVSVALLEAGERTELLAAYEASTIAYLAAALPEAVSVSASLPEPRSP